jgi:hypothetical protein
MSKVFLEEIKLLPHASFKVVSHIDVKVPDGVMFNFRVFPQHFLSFFHSGFRHYTVMITYLEQDRTTHVPGVLERPVFVPPAV